MSDRIGFVAPAVLAVIMMLVSAGRAAAQSPVASPTPGATTVTPVATATPSPTAAATATPIPPPTGVAVRTEVVIGRPDGTFIPPSERTATNHVTWNAVTGFGGVYEVERLIDRSLTNNIFVRVASVNASAAMNGQLEYTEEVAFSESTSIKRCYRVRAVSGAQVSAYSQQACTQLPPRSGGAEPSPAASPTPLPPVVGTGTAAGGSAWPVVAGAAALLASALALFAVRRHPR